MFEEQGGVCAICFTDDPGQGWQHLAVDHCHETGKVRGLLCGACNSGIGHLQDSLDIVLSAAEYLGNV